MLERLRRELDGKESSPLEPHTPDRKKFRRKSADEFPFRKNARREAAGRFESVMTAGNLLLPRLVRISMFFRDGHEENGNESSGKKKQKTGTPNGIRTRVARMKTWCPRPLDDRGLSLKCHIKYTINSVFQVRNQKLFDNFLIPGAFQPSDSGIAGGLRSS